MDEEQRDVEIGSLSAIFPELEVDENDPHIISLEVPVKPDKSITVYFPAVNDGLNPTVVPPAGPAVPVIAAQPPGAEQEDSHQLEHLPSVRVQVTLPKGYPESEPPRATVTTSPPWLPEEIVSKLQEDAPRIWEEFGRDLVVFSYIDQIQQAAENVFGLVSDNGALQVDAEHKIAILDYDIKAKRETFNKGTFNCGICIEPKKGVACHSMTDCGHVFCKACLCDFYNNAIKEGDLATIRCLEPNCGKERVAAWAASDKKGRKPKLAITPGELLQMSVEQEVVQRYVQLKYKNELESDQKTVYCPRSWCGGAARSKRHKKPQGLESTDDADEFEAETQAKADAKDGTASESEKLAVCEDCGFAFCSRCKGSWHGDFVYCAPRQATGEIDKDEQASLDYMVEFSTPCPTCAARVQKTGGCNHMICYRCQSHFCYLCSSWLSPDNPYQHYNEQPNGKRTYCYMRLWELEEGDGANQVQPPRQQRARFNVRPANELPPPPAPIIEEPDDEPDAGARNGNPGQIEVNREGPLVLRIAGLPIPPPAPVPPAPPAVAARAAAGQARRRAAQNAQANQPGGAQERVHRRGWRRVPGQGNPADNGRRLAQDAAQEDEGGIIPRDMPRGPGPRRVLGADRAAAGQVPGDGNDGHVDEAMGHWIRRFVELAMDDEEHFPDSDEEEETDEEVIVLPRNPPR